MIRLVTTFLFSAVLASPAIACSCMFTPPPPGVFLHLNQHGRIALPANARGVLFMKHVELDVLHSTESVTILKAMPPAMGPDFFAMRDITAQKAVKAHVVPVDVDAQMGNTHTYYLARAGQMPHEDAYGDHDDLHKVASRHGLTDVSLKVKSAHGMLRVAPAGGFKAGHEYSLTPRQLSSNVADTALIAVGPPVPAGSGIALTRVGPPATQLIDVAGGAMCSEKRAAVVQRVAYVLPRERQQYHNMLMAFTFQQTVKRGAQEPFALGSYRSDPCRPDVIGVSESGRGQERILGRCPNPGEDYEGRLVRGYAGILELDEALQQSATLVMPFDGVDKALCRQLRLKADRYE